MKNCLVSLPRLLGFLLLALTLAAGCDLLEGREEEESPTTTGVYVANQGNFSDGNGSVTVYDPLTEGAATLVRDIGSIIQSITLHGRQLYVMANTGERVYRYDLSAPEEPPRQVEGVTSPRYMAVLGEHKAYVTSFYGESGSFSGGKVTVIDPASMAVLKEIPVGDNPEGIAVVGDRAYVAHHGFGAGRTLSVIDTSADEVVDTVNVDCDGPRVLLADAEGDVFVFCTGQTLYDENFNVVGETNGAVRVLDGRTGAVTERLAVDGRISTAGPGQDAFYAPEAREIYAVKDGNTILRFDTEQNVQVGQIGPIEGEPVGAVAYDAVSERLYVGRTAGFTERGRVTIHGRDGTPVGSFTAGISPTYIAFQQEE